MDGDRQAALDHFDDSVAHVVIRHNGKNLAQGIDLDHAGAQRATEIPSLHWAM